MVLITPFPDSLEDIFGRWVQKMSSEKTQISSERIDDIPVIVEWLVQMEIAKLIGQKLNKPHGNHQGLIPIHNSQVAIRN
ncbi:MULTISPECIES: hypothetical protein [Nostoc]|uniref:Uncharacterized protein n=2 Tax=Nostoc TaxID=1177 RepID=A0ABR8IBH4_9NOSO|nr:MULTISPECIES: hypothetical protein [Nostoc]MBD2562013.1 hypothetical protein [Nostoc linckia FACHB-391]MBD2648614.1 hypothetical protein [Nostoc foliaceum FACHB-393]